MKRSALQCVVGFVGATLIVVGVVWICRQVSTPTQLNAAQEASDSSIVCAKESVPKSSGIRLASGEEPATETYDDADEGAYDDGVSRLSIDPHETQINLSLVESDEAPPKPAKIARNADSGEALDSLLNGESTNDEYEDSSASESYSDSSFTSSLELSSEDDEGNYERAQDLGLEVDADSFPDYEEGLDLSDDQNVADAETSSSYISLGLEEENAADVDVLPLEEVAPSKPQVESLDLARAPQALSENAVATTDVAPPRFVQNGATEVSTPLSPAPSSASPALSAPSESTPLPTMSQYQKTTQTAATNDDARFGRVEKVAQVPRGSFELSGDSDATLWRMLVEAFKRKSTPGSTDIQGAQTAQVVVEKTAPEEVQVGRVASIVVTVKNLGSQTIRNASLRDVVPEGTRFVSAEPEVAPNAQGDLIWTKIDLEPQREKKFEIKVVPEQECAFGSVASLFFAVDSTSSTRATQPKIQVEVNAPREIELGKKVDFDIVITNVGSGAAANVEILESIPDGLYHPSGSTLDNKLGTLNAGESKRLPLTLQTVASGEVVNHLKAIADDCEEQNVETAIKILAPKLELAISGATNVYLERTTTYKLSVKNVGDASAYDVKLIAQLPDGAAFVKANNLGAYKESEHCVYWDLAELPAQTDGEIELTLKAAKIGKSDLTFGASGPNNLTAQTSQEITTDGVAALSFNVESGADLIEVGKEFEYSIQIVNRGTKASKNVVLQVLAPDAMSILATDGPTQAVNRNGVVVFEKLAEIPAKSSVSYKIKAAPKTSGDCRVEFQLSSDDLEPLVKEENTRVYE